MKKKSKPKASAKPARARSTSKQKVANPAEMRQSITDMVELEMENIGRAVLEEAKRGQLATVKYLFEVSGVYPASAEQSQEKPEEGETLARLLLTRLGMPLEPAISPDDEVPQRNPAHAEKKTVKRRDEDSAEDPSEEAGARPKREADDSDDEAVVPVP